LTHLGYSTIHLGLNTTHLSYIDTNDWARLPLIDPNKPYDPVITQPLIQRL